MTYISDASGSIEPNTQYVKSNHCQMTQYCFDCQAEGIDPAPEATYVVQIAGVPALGFMCDRHESDWRVRSIMEGFGFVSERLPYRKRK